MRGHTPIKITEFNGLWKRGDAESTPLDHFSDCKNLQYIESGVKTRDGVSPYVISTNLCGNLDVLKRMYTYVRPDRQSVLALDNAGNIYDTGSTTPCTPILSIPGMTDFAYAAWAGRAYINPNNGVTGLEDEFLYVYLGDGATARKAAGAGPTGTMTAATASGGYIAAGYHVFGVVYETNTGFLTKVGGNVAILVDGTQKVDLSAIPISPDTFVVKRHIVVTKYIPTNIWNGDLINREFFFLPNGTINDNTTTTLSGINFYDGELLEDASYLIDLLEEVPAGVGLSIYHNRLVSVAEFGEVNADPTLDTSGNISLARVSNEGDPESFDPVDGIIVAPIDGTALTAAQEYRDILYLFKNTRTHSYVDNGDVPSTWRLTTIDQGIGCPPHGIALVLDSGGTNIDFLIICDYSGVILFNGGYQRPELSYKIQDSWLAINKTSFNLIQILNDTVLQRIYIVLPDGTMLYADYSHGMDPKSIRWCPWVFNLRLITIALIDTNTLLLGLVQ